MYATNGLADVLGISANELNGKSFYYCIQENCLREAVKCLESAKANDSIAYLRFWFRDPRQDDQVDHDERMSDGHSTGDEDDGGVHLSELMDQDGSETAVISASSHSLRSSVERDQGASQNIHTLDPNSRSSSGDSSDSKENGNDTIFDESMGVQTRTSSISTMDESHSPRRPWSPGSSHIELEAVVSCTSDGLVVILRRARPFVPQLDSSVPHHSYVNGLFASPWANDPILPDADNRSLPLPESHRPSQAPVHPTSAQATTATGTGPITENFMNSIREVAVFAWALTGINGSLAEYSRGIPTGESQPPGGLPVWDPTSSSGSDIERHANDFAHDPHYGHMNSYQMSGHDHSSRGISTINRERHLNGYHVQEQLNGHANMTHTNRFDISNEANTHKALTRTASYNTPAHTNDAWMQHPYQKRAHHTLGTPERNHAFRQYEDLRFR